MPKKVDQQNRRRRISHARRAAEAWWEKAGKHNTKDENSYQEILTSKDNDISIVNDTEMIMEELANQTLKEKMLQLVQTSFL